MSELRIDLPTEQRSFRPGEAIEGVVSWTLDAAAHAVEVRLLWYTRGKGDGDVGVADLVRFDAPASADSQIFRFIAPNGPWSFDGRLVSLVWAIDAIADLKGLKSDLVRRVDLTIGPDGRPVTLTSTALAPGDGADDDGSDDAGA
ncbi:MAG: hypothetical protein KDA25_10305 [Phycisphaerales bacterium]|nr:hypothetical protein [Phycisphaerales bacterium]